MQAHIKKPYELYPGSVAGGKPRGEDIAPPGWEPCLDKNGITQWRCPFQQINCFTQKLERCSCFFRKDQISKHLNHKHRFDIPPQYDELLHPDTIQINSMSIQQLNEKIEQIVAIAMGRLNISANKACSNAMKQMIIALVELGYSNKDNKNFYPSTQIYKISRERVTRLMILYSEKIKEDNLNMLRFYRYVNLIMDAGTVNNYKAVHCIFTTPRLPSLFPIELPENRNFSYLEYQSLFQEIFMQAHDKNIEICGVAIDNCPAQLKGFFQMKKDGVTSLMRAAIWIPCLNHMTNLVFADTLKSPEYSKTFSKMSKLINTLRTNSIANEIGSICPGLIKTRWIYALLPASFILLHGGKIQELQLCSADDIQIYKDFYLCILPLYIFSQIMEERSCCLSDVIPCIMKIMSIFKEVNNDLQTDFGRKMLCSIIVNFISRLKTNNYPYILSSFALNDSQFHREFDI